MTNSRAPFVPGFSDRKPAPVEPAPPLRGFILLQGVELDRADCVDLLDYTIVDPFTVWSVYADYGTYQRQIAYTAPCLVSSGDATYAVGTGLQGDTCYVDGSVFVPSVVRSRLTDLAAYGVFDRLRPYLPCVTCKPVLTTNGPTSPYKALP